MWKLQLPRASRSKSRGYRAAKSIAEDRKAVARREEAQHTARVRAERNAEEAFYCWNNANTHTSQAEIHFHRVRIGLATQRANVLLPSGIYSKYTKRER